MRCIDTFLKGKKRTDGANTSISQYENKFARIILFINFFSLFKIDIIIYRYFTIFHEMKVCT